MIMQDFKDEHHYKEPSKFWLLLVTVILSLLFIDAFVKDLDKGKPSTFTSVKPTSACIETHYKQNQKETMVFCGKIVKL